VLGSAGGPRKALPLLDAERFLIVNGDTLTDADPRALLAEHARSGALATLTVIPNPAPQHYGGVLVNDDGSIARFVPRGTPGPSWHFIGLQAAEASVFDGVSPSEPSESVGALYPRLMRERPGSIRAFRTSASFFDIGTPADYLDTTLALLASEGTATGEGRARPVAAGRGCRVSPSAWLEGTVLWDDVTVGADARLTGCIVTDGAIIPPGLRLERRAVVAAHGRPVAAGEERQDDLLIVHI
jgi:mannose-1-phosphate guanylyltransferase